MVCGDWIAWSNGCLMRMSMLLPMDFSKPESVEWLSVFDSLINWFAYAFPN